MVRTSEATVPGPEPLDSLALSAMTMPIAPTANRAMTQPMRTPGRWCGPSP